MHRMLCIRPLSILPPPPPLPPTPLPTPSPCVSFIIPAAGALQSFHKPEWISEIPQGSSSTALGRLLRFSPLWPPNQLFSQLVSTQQVLCPLPSSQACPVLSFIQVQLAILEACQGHPGYASSSADLGASLARHGLAAIPTHDGSIGRDRLAYSQASLQQASADCPDLNNWQARQRT